MTVSSTTTKNSYSGNGSTHSFAYGFKIFADADLTVIIRSSTGAETVRTLNTHYVVTNAGISSGGNVLFKFNTGTSSDAHFSSSDFRPASGETVVIRRNLTLTQGTDYVENDPFPAESHENALDRVTFITQQLQEELDRSIKLSRTNTITSPEFTTSSTDRANKVLAFDSSGEIAVTQEIGTFRGNWAASTSYLVRDIVKDTSTNNIFIVTSAHTSSGSQPLTTNANSAKYSLIVDAASSTSAQTAAASSATAAASSETAAVSSASTATTKASEAASSATAAASSETAAASSATSAASSLSTFQGQYHGAASSNPSSNLDAGDLYFNTSTGNIKVYSGSAWEDIKPTSSEQTNLNIVAGVTGNINTIAGIASDVSTVASHAGAIEIIGTDLGNNFNNISDFGSITSSVSSASGTSLVKTVSDAIANINTVASLITTDFSTGISLVTNDFVSDVNTLATSDIVTDLNLIATSANVTNMQNVTDNLTAIQNAAENAQLAAGVSFLISAQTYNISSNSDFGAITDTGSGAVFSSEDANTKLSMSLGSGQLDYQAIA